MSLSQSGKCPKSRGGHHRWIEQTESSSAHVRHFVCFACKEEAWHSVDSEASRENQSVCPSAVEDGDAPAIVKVATDLTGDD